MLVSLSKAQESYSQVPRLSWGLETVTSLVNVFSISYFLCASGAADAVSIFQPHIQSSIIFAKKQMERDVGKVDIQLEFIYQKHSGWWLS